MGNTNLPQFGAADVENSRDTRTGEQQLADDQRKAGDVGPAPGRPKNAPERIPGQQRDPADADEEDREQRDVDSGIERPGPGDSSKRPAGSEPIAAFGGHANTGHSPCDAT